jgi:hypothetical protein
LRKAEFKVRRIEGIRKKIERLIAERDIKYNNYKVG